MLLVVVLSARALRRQEQRYGRLLAKYTRIRADGEHGIQPPDWVNGANVRYLRRSKDMNALRVLHDRETKGANDDS